MTKDHNFFLHMSLGLKFCIKFIDIHKFVSVTAVPKYFRRKQVQCVCFVCLPLEHQSVVLPSRVKTPEHSFHLLRSKASVIDINQLT